MEPLTITPAAKEKDEREGEKKKKFLNREPSFISETVLKLCFVSQLSAIISISRLHESDIGGGGGGRRDRRARTFEKPFHTAWSGDMDPMRQRRGTQYFKVT